MTLGPEWETIPDVAQSWEISKDGCRYIFHLRDDVYWNDGVQVTAVDFAYALQRTLNPTTEAPRSAATVLHDIKNARAYHSGEVSDPDQVGVKTIDPLTLEVELEKPASYFLDMLTFRFPVPRHVVEAYGEAWTDPANLVTNGPFQLESYQPGVSINLVRNPAYHGRFSGNLQRVEVNLSIPGGLTEELAMYESDSVDIANLGEATYPARHRHIEEYISEPQLRMHFVGFDTRHPPFDNPRVRQAFVMSVDREKLADEVLHGYQYPASGGLVPPGIAGHSPGIGLCYDPDQARQLLAQAGYPGGCGFPSLKFVGTGSQNLVLEYLRDQWLHTLNVEISIEIREFAKVLKEMHSINLVLMGWSTEYPDPDHFIRVFIRSTVPHWQNKIYDRLLKEARRTSNQGDRIPLYQAADKTLIEEAAIMPLLYGRIHRLLKPWVKIRGGGINSLSLKDTILEPH
jgi:oligopeptide transport system substrate-binding protein